MNIDFIYISPFLIMILSSILLALLHKISNISGYWESNGLALIPIAYIIQFLIIVIFSMDIEKTRLVLRLTLTFSFGCAIYVSCSILKRMRGL